MVKNNYLLGIFIFNMEAKMCEPTSIMAVGSLALTAYSGWIEGRTQRAEGIAKSNYFNYIADQREIDAKEAVKAGERQTDLIQDSAMRAGKRLKQTQAQLSASQLVTMAANGMDISSVSAEDIISSTHKIQREDELALRYNADIKSWGVMTDANYKSWANKNYAEQARYSARNALRAGKIAARNTYLKTAASLLGSASRFGSKGMFSVGTTSQPAQMSFVGGGVGPIR